MNNALSAEMKMAAQMGMRAGVEMAIDALMAAQANPRSQNVAPIYMALQGAVDTLRLMASKKWPEGRA